MATLKTIENNASVKTFLENIENEQQRKDAFVLLELMKKVTGIEPSMWGDSMVGFGKYHYKYDSGREGDWFLTGFSPRKQNLTLYIMSGFANFDEKLTNLGKFKKSVGCLYVKKLEDINLTILEEMIIESVAAIKQRYK
ncbi:MAG: DUF1801 domain-containing protein [Cyclobacteriaceae bacterium]|nr:DUF1801 domain-containing protein [Cyclobacteriaceae bacterium]